MVLRPVSGSRNIATLLARGFAARAPAYNQTPVLMIGSHPGIYSFTLAFEGRADPHHARLLITDSGGHRLKN